ncbi:MAG: MFS transporter [bacterium]|nr:MFS transporter [bacterium]
MIVASRTPSDATVIASAPETPGCASHAKRWVLAAAILGSSLAFVEASVLNVALPAIQQALGATVGEMQWIASGYTVLLASLTLAGGAAGDRFGRRRVFQLGTLGLGIASIGAALAPDAATLVLARAAQGLGAALLVPNSLALLSAAFPRAERGRAIGTWSAVTSMVGALSPLVGGWFVDALSWRLAFVAFLPLVALTLAIGAWRVPDPPVMRRPAPVDWPGAALATIGLVGLVGGLIALGGGATPGALAALGAGTAGLVAFVAWERHTAAPMVPPALFGSRAFSGANLLTVLVYGGVTGVFFLLPFNLVEVQGYSSTATGAAFLPFALALAMLSRRAGALADRVGTRPLLVLGPLFTAAGLACFAIPGVGGTYWATFLAPMTLTGVGMALTAAPLTAGVLAAVPPGAAGVASGVNNAAARVGTLLAVAVVGVVALALYTAALDRRLAASGVPAEVARVLVEERRSLADTALPPGLPSAEQARLAALVDAAFVDAFRRAVLWCAFVTLLGGLTGLVTLGTLAADRDEGDSPMPVCSHLDMIRPVHPHARGCEECLRLGDAWVHLRLCLTCGHVGCCDSSKNRHATKHFWASQHPIVRSLEPGEDWRWCYVDETVV